MYSRDITRILQLDSEACKYFKGVYAANELRRFDSQEYFIIVNTQNAGMPGEHWQLIWVRGKACYFFCSLGQMPKDSIKTFVNTFSRVYHNTTSPQQGSEVTCGGYAIFVASMLARKHSFRNICKLFDVIKGDDTFIRHFLKEAYAYNITSVNTLHP